LAGIRYQVRGIRCPGSGVGFLGQDYRRVVMGLPPTRANEKHPCRHPSESGGPLSLRNTMDSRFRRNAVLFGAVPMGLQPNRVHEKPHVIPAYGHAMACPYSLRRGLSSGELVSTEASAREPAQRSSRAGSRIEEKRTCEKDVKNRGNELNNSFRINKSVKETNSKRTDFACKKEQLEAKKEQTARERGGSRLEQKMPIPYSNICFKQSFDERLQGNWPTVPLVFGGNKARMSMKTNSRAVEKSRS